MRDRAIRCGMEVICGIFVQYNAVPLVRGDVGDRAGDSNLIEISTQRISV